MIAYILEGLVTGALIVAGHVAVYYVLCNPKGGRDGS